MLCPTAPSLPWVAWASLPHLRRSYAPLRLPSVPLRGLRVSRVPRYRACFRCAWCPVRARRLVEAPGRRQGLWSPGPLCRAWRMETGGSPTFPRFPSADMPRSQTPGVSCALAIPHPGLLPAGACTPSAFAAIPLRLSCCPRLDRLRGSITRPASSLPPASYAHGWVCTWRLLLTGWLGVGQVGLALSLSPTG